MITLSQLIGPDERPVEIPIGRQGVLVDYVWVRRVPERPKQGIFERICDAGKILLGEAVALRWPIPGELEMAMRDKRFDKAAPFDSDAHPLMRNENGG